MMWADAHRGNEDCDQEQNAPLDTALDGRTGFQAELAALAKSLGVRYGPPVPRQRDGAES